MASAPPLAQYLKEVRALGEFAQFWMSSTTDGLPAGDGHPVIVYPGFWGSDTTTSLFRARLSALGYDVHGWELGTNMGLKADTLSEVRSQLVHVTRKAGRPASLFGWSLGGLFAREVAKRRPDCVRQVITAGTPCMGDLHWTNAWKTYERVNDHSIDAPPIDTDLSELPPVPVTSMYSESDGIVARECAIIGNGERHQTVPVEGSHCGMMWNSDVLAVTAERLALPEDGWTPWSPSD